MICEKLATFITLRYSTFKVQQIRLVFGSITQQLISSPQISWQMQSNQDAQRRLWFCQSIIRLKHPAKSIPIS